MNRINFLDLKHQIDQLLLSTSQLYCLQQYIDKYNNHAEMASYLDLFYCWHNFLVDGIPVACATPYILYTVCVHQFTVLCFCMYRDLVVKILAIHHCLEFKASACSKFNYIFLLIMCLWWVVFSVLYLAIWEKTDII